MEEQHKDEFQERLEKLELLKQSGIDPFKTKGHRDFEIGHVIENFDNLSDSQKKFKLVGRLRTMRLHGNIIFADLEDFSGKIQLVFTKKNLGDAYKLIQKTYNASDFIEISGNVFLTKKGEKSVEVFESDILTKSLRSIPDSYHGLKNEETRFRKRYLDILLNPEIRELLVKKSLFWQSVRDFLKEKGFIEVETPVLETTPGGADASPFITHHNALDIDVYLRISMGELWQKRLMVAGFEKTFEIGRQFRNEGMSPEHLQDYTQMEFYWAYADFNDGMKLTEEMYKFVAKKTFGTLQFTIGEHEVDLSKSWERYDYRETVMKHTGIDVLTATIDDVEEKLKELGVKYSKDGLNLARGIDLLWKFCRKKISGPGFLTGVPVAISPLAKRDPENSELTQRFQPIIAGSELGNGYSELNDPIDQAERFEAQQKLRDEGDDEAQMHDRDFVEALEYGMPPTCGFGMSERVFSFLANKTLRETQAFPLVRPKHENE